MNNNDPLGHSLIRERCDKSFTFVQEMLTDTFIPVREPESTTFIATGIGSSEAHARYFVYCVNRFTKGTAVFWPLSYFASFVPHLYCRRNTLVVFSQGLSPNINLAINKGDFFNDRVLFTSAQSKPIYSALKKRKWSIVPFPMENESETLIRVAGPICCYVAIYLYLKHVFINNDFPEIAPQDILNAIDRARKSRVEYLPQDFKDMQESLMLIGATGLPEFGQNLCYKFTEGIFSTSATLIDILSLCHGFLQQMCMKPRHVFFLMNGEDWEDSVVQKSMDVLHRINCRTNYYKARLPDPFPILEFEFYLNNYLVAGLEQLQLNQRQWPGYGLDKPLYDITAL